MVRVAEAKAVCARCRVRPECLGFALARRDMHGVWGGISEEDRRLLGTLRVRTLVLAGELDASTPLEV